MSVCVWTYENIYREAIRSRTLLHLLSSDDSRASGRRRESWLTSMKTDRRTLFTAFNWSGMTSLKKDLWISYSILSVTELPVTKTWYQHRWASSHLSQLPFFTLLYGRYKSLHIFLLPPCRQFHPLLMRQFSNCQAQCATLERCIMKNKPEELGDILCHSMTGKNSLHGELVRPVYEEYFVRKQRLPSSVQEKHPNPHPD